MTKISNYGSKLCEVVSGSATEIAGLVKLAPPKFKNEKLDATTHDSGGWKEFISSNLVEIEDFTATYAFDNTVVSKYFSYFTSGCVANYEIQFPNSVKYDFSALITEFAPGEADSNKPELTTVEVTFSASGSMVVS